MDKAVVQALLEQVASGTLDPTAAAEQLAIMPYSDLGFARVDVHRAIRQGSAEVIFCPGKSNDQIIAIARALSEHHKLVIATRAAADVAAVVVAALPTAQYIVEARAIIFGALPEVGPNAAKISIITAGTSDIPVAEEAALIVVAAGYGVSRMYDVGVAGVQRLLDNLEVLRQAEVTIVIAGMDGALASVVGGLLDKPIIAVPTSIGYGASFAGLAALLSMLSSCAPGVTVVNIDNGFGAAMAALRLLRCLDKG